MKLINEAFIPAIVAAVRPLAKLYDCQSCDTKHNAQRNLAGRTHFADGGTLRYFKSRIVGASAFADGLLFKLTESSAMDMHGQSRGFRVHVFDLFGTHVFGVDIDKASKTRNQAKRVFESAEFDILAHYKQALTSKRDWFIRDAENFTEALAKL
jgi:hypothetical protein